MDDQTFARRLEEYDAAIQGWRDQHDQAEKMIAWVTRNKERFISRRWNMATILDKDGKVVAEIKWQYQKGTCPLCGYIPFNTKTHDCGVQGQRITWKD